MKKITLFMAFIAVAMFTNAAEWVETFGPDDVAKNESGYWPTVSVTEQNYIYKNYDHASECTYTGSSASVRKVNPSPTTAGIGNHLWLAAPKPANPPTYPTASESWFSISGINQSCELISFDLAPNSDGYKPNIKVWINDVEVVLPPITLATANVLQTIQIPLKQKEMVYSIEIENFDANSGIRFDNLSLLTNKYFDNVQYSVVNNAAYVQLVPSTIFSIDIPSSVTFESISYPVVGILPYAFANNPNLSSVTIPESVTTIDASAFSGCSGLTSITIPSSVTSIGDYAFYDCSSLTSITIPESVTSIGVGAFFFCFSLTSITIPTSVTSIGDYAFYYCSSLTSITIPESVTSIGYYAFYNCSSLTSITIPASVTSIGVGAFSGTSLTSLIFNAESCADFPHNSEDSDYTGPFYDLTTLQTVTIGENVKNIPAWFISGCDNVTSIIIPESLTSIGVGAFSGTSLTSLIFNAESCADFPHNSEDSDYTGPFYDLTTLQTVTIGENVKNIPAWFISGCDNVTSIIIPSSVTSIGSSAFKNTGLTSIVIPTSVTSISEETFSGCSALTSVSIPASVANIGSSSFLDCVGLTTITIPVNVSNIGSQAFANTGLTSLVYNAANCPTAYFANLSYLNSVIIGSGVLNIPANFISGCSNVTSLNIPESVTSIGYYAFYNCSSLTSITIPTSVTSIGVGAFSGTSLTSLVFNAASCADFPSEDYDYNYTGPFYDLTTLQTVTIGENVKNIPAWFISGCDNVTSIIIPESVTSIGVGAFSGTSLTSLVFNAASCADFPSEDYDYNYTGPFYDLTTLHSVTIGETVKHIPAYFINGCNNVTSITIPEGVTNIGERAFSGCSGLTLITIPSSVTSVGNAVFAGCLGLTSITIPSSVTSIGNSVFWRCSGLTSLTIPSSVTSIGDEAFYYCSGLTSITIPSSVTSIGEHAFDGCEQLTQLELPSIKTIAPYAFANCIRLSKAMFGQNLEEIGEYAFENCGKLIRITCYATIVPFCNENSFANYNGYLYVPCDLLPDYSADLLFGKFQNIQCIAAEPSTGTTEVTIVSGATDATFTWPVSDNTQSYTLEISKDGEVFCTLRFNGNGQLLGISFAPSNGTETQNTGAALTALGYQFSVTGLNSASLYTYELKALDASNNELASYAGQFSTDGYVGIGNVEFIEGVYAQNGAIVIDNDTNLPVAIYDVVGRLVVSGSSLTQYFEVPNAGVYIVKVGDQTMKVLVP